MASIFIPAEIDTTFHAKLMHFQREAASGEVAARLLDAVYGWDVTDVSQHVRAPTLVIHGAVDPLVPPAAGEDTAKAVPGAKLMVIPKMGHDLPEPLIPQLVDAIASHAAATALR